MSVLVAPSILSANFAALGEAVAAAERGGADLIHVDVMDGHFVPNLTLGPMAVEAIRRATRLPLDVHLMVEEPRRFIDRFRDAGADWLTIHVEADRHTHRTLGAIRELGARPGLALNPGTPLSAAEELLDNLDLLVVMSVNPGFGGQSFIPAALDKVRRARALLDAHQSSAELEVDGGIKLDNAPRVAAAGASVLVAGSFVYLEGDGIEQNIAALRSAVTAQL